MSSGRQMTKSSHVGFRSIATSVHPETMGHSWSLCQFLLHRCVFWKNSISLISETSSFKQLCSKLGTVPSTIGGCPKGLRAMKLWQLWMMNCVWRISLRNRAGEILKHNRDSLCSGRSFCFYIPPEMPYIIKVFCLY
jgi:hypothetical protein